MGCASSAPLVEQGKHLVESVKDTASDTVAKGEKALQNTTETIKDGVQTVLTTAEESVGTVAHKIGETFAFTAKSAEEAEQHVLDASKEAVSEAETVIVSETEQAREAFQSGTAPFFETVRSLEEDVEAAVKDSDTAIEVTETEVLEDLEEVEEQRNVLGETVEVAQSKVEELMPEEREGEAKEEVPTTLWETAADAILLKNAAKVSESPPSATSSRPRIFFKPPDRPDLDPSDKMVNDIVVENADNIEC